MIDFEKIFYETHASVTTELQERIDGLIKQVQDQFNLGECKITFSFDNKLRTTAGMAHTNRDFKGGRIDFSKHYWNKATEEETDNTVVHEAAHIICNCYYKTFNGHNAHWKSLMVFFGKEPKRCHNVSVRHNRNRRI